MVAHEWTLAVIGSLLLASTLTWPALRHPAGRLPEGLTDPAREAWQLAWSGHALQHDPAHLYRTNAFFPAGNSFAFFDNLLGWAPGGLIGIGMPAALLRYNIIFVLAFALAFLGSYALLRQLGAARAGAAVAGIGFAFAPWRWGQVGHLDVLSSGGIVLALAMLARGHGFSLRTGYRPERVRLFWLITGWLVACWQLSVSVSLGVPFAYALGGLVALGVAGWLVKPVALSGFREWRTTRRRLPIRLLIADLIGGSAFVAACVALARPYFALYHAHPDARPTGETIRDLSPPPRGWLVAPAESWFWGGRHADIRAALHQPAETALLLGFVLLGLAVAGLLLSVWSWRTRLLLLLGAVASALFAMGLRAPFGGRFTYQAAHTFLPGWAVVAAPGRLVLWTTLLICILAAGAVSGFVARVQDYTNERIPARPGFVLRLAMLLPVALVVAEGVPAVKHQPVPIPPAALRNLSGPMLILPSSPSQDQLYLLWSVQRFPRIVNGSGGYTPERQLEIREAMTAFPDEASVQQLRDLDVHTVVVVKKMIIGTPYERTASPEAELAATDLGVDRAEDADTIVFQLP